MKSDEQTEGSSRPTMTDSMALAFRDQTKPQRVLYINASTMPIFRQGALNSRYEVAYSTGALTKTAETFVHGDPLLLLDSLGEKFDLIIGDLPLGMTADTWINEEKKITIKAKRNWLMMLKSLFALSVEGTGLFVVEPSLWHRQWLKFEEAMNHWGFYVKAVFSTPDGCLQPQTPLRPYVIAVARKKPKQVFIADPADEESITRIVARYFEGESGGSIENGLYVTQPRPRSVEFYRRKEEIDRLSAQYKSYKAHMLADLTIEIIMGRHGEDLVEKENSIYIPRLGKSPVIKDLNAATLKHQNYMQLVLDKKVVLNSYAALLFSSELGRAIRASMYTGMIPKLTKGDLTNIEIPVPHLDEQESIVATYEQLLLLEKRLTEFQQELSLNPKSAAEVRVHTEKMLEQVDMLTEADRIRSLIRKNETDTCEFKETLNLDVRKQTRESYLLTEVTKTVAAFLNSHGGTLLIGVSDDGVIKGVGAEVEKLFKGSRDKFMLHFKNIIKSQIGEDFYPSIDYGLVPVDGADVLRVHCRESTTPCFVGGKDFYVRTNPATDRLEGKKLVDYIKQHFG